MGLLKHLILPLFTIMHALSIYSCRSLSSWAEMVELTLESPITDNESLRQLHMLGCLRGFNAAMMVLCALGVATESSHFRSVVALSEIVLFGTVAMDAFELGLNFYVPATMVGVMMVGGVVNLMEPGIFTKDKNKAKGD